MSGLAKKHRTDKAKITIAGPKRNVERVLRLVGKLDYQLVDESTSLNWRAVLKEPIEKYGEPGAGLKGARLREGLSQVELAKKCRTTQGAVSGMENGHRPIGKRMAKRLGDVLNTDYRTLL